MAQDDVVLGVGVDPSGAQSGARQATRSLEEIRKAARETDDATHKTSRSFNEMGRASEDLSRAPAT